MKKLNIKYFAVLIILFIVGCEAPTVGYNTYEWGKDYKYSLGSEESIEIAMAFDKAWDERDFETMSELLFISDSIRFYGGDGILRNLDYVKVQPFFEKIQLGQLTEPHWMQNSNMFIP